MTTLLARPVRRLRRRPLPYWLVAAAVAALTALVLGRLTADITAERARWGTLRPTVVLVRDVDRGAPIGADDLAVRRLPVAVLPRGTLADPPVGALAAVELHAGEALLADRLLGHGTSAVAARLPPGTRGVAVPGDTGLPLEEGDLVDVLATFDPGATAGEPTVVVAREAQVVAVGEDAVTVAVDTATAPKVAYALAAGAVTLVLAAPG